MEKYIINGMGCNRCRTKVENAVSSLSGVTAVSVDLKSGELTVEGSVTPADVISTVTSLGYDCKEID